MLKYIGSLCQTSGCKVTFYVLFFSLFNPSDTFFLLVESDKNMVDKFVKTFELRMLLLLSQIWTLFIHLFASEAVHIQI